MTDDKQKWENYIELKSSFYDDEGEESLKYRILWGGKEIQTLILPVAEGIPETFELLGKLFDYVGLRMKKASAEVIVKSWNEKLNK